MSTPLTLRDIMTTDVVTIGPDATLRQVAEVLAMEGISGVPVVSDGRVLGVISASDIVDFAASTPNVLPDSPPSRRRVQHGWENEPRPGFYSEWAVTGDNILERFTRQAAVPDALQESTAKDIMTRSICALQPDTGVHEAAEYMLKVGVHRVLVTEGDDLVGVVSTLDFMRALAERRL